MQLENQVAVVTGGSSGIGRAIALALATEGADVAFCHLEDAQAEETIAALKAIGRNAYASSFDVRDLAALKKFFSEVDERFGTPDILVNNVGDSRFAAFEHLTCDSFDFHVETNLRSTVFATHHVYRNMMARGSGRIINIASQLALRGEEGMLLYATTKAAILGFTRSLAREATRHGVLVNAIAPGPVATEHFMAAPADKRAEIKARLLVDRLGTPEEIAATAVLLAGAGGGFYAGACLSPNGGDVLH